MATTQTLLLLGLMTVGMLAVAAPAEAHVTACAQWLLNTPVGGHTCVNGYPDWTPGCYANFYEAITRTGAVVEFCL